MTDTLSSLRVLAKSVLIEAMRRKEIYVIVAVCSALIGAAMSLDFFGLGGLVKFYREIALKLMGISTALTVIVLATRQLPREFEHRTIYPLLARPVTRGEVLLGKTIAAWITGLCVYLGPILSLFLPKSLAIGTGAVLVFASGTMKRWRWIGNVLHAIPSPVKSNLTLRYTDGAPPLSAPDLTLLLLYLLVWIGILLAVSIRGFTRRALT